MNIKNSKQTLFVGLCSILFLGNSPQAFAVGEAQTPPAVQQTKKVSGVVNDAMGPIIGASVKIKGTSTGVATDFDGKFNLSVQPGATLVVSYIGYVTKEVKVGNQSEISIMLVEDKKLLDEVVVVGYGTMKKSDISGSSVNLGEKAMKGSIITSLDQSLQGRAAGVTAVSTSGAPGTASSIRVRGTATINSNAEPLYVIDGVIVQTGSTSGSSLGFGDALDNGPTSTVSPLSTINPADIVSMEILKDASATAIYGAQGANGVVLITTKRGKAGEAKFSYDGMVAWSRQTKRLDMMNLREFGDYYNDFVASGFGGIKEDPYYSDVSLLGKGTNWQDAIFQTAFQQQHQFSAQGGTEKIQYYVSAGYMDQEGTIIGSEFNRLSVRTNLDAQLKSWLKLGLSATFSDSNDNLKLTDGAEGIVGFALSSLPEAPIYDIDGNYASFARENYSIHNPIAKAMEQNNMLNRKKLNGNIYAEVTPIKNLVWHAEIGYDIGYSKAEIYNNAIDLPNWKEPNESSIQKNNNTYWQLKNYITYSNTFAEKHSMTAMMGQECWESKWDYTKVANTNLPSDAVHNPQLGTGTATINAGFGSSSMASFFTRWTYSYDNRYNATYTYRYDGSSNFGPNNRWAGFHSAAASWRFTNEKFMKNIKWMSNGKLRLGWGQTGNSNINSYVWGVNMQQVYTALGNGYRPQNIPNLDVRWEKQSQIDVGLDIGLFNDRVNLTIDWYQKESKDMLMELQLPSYMGTQGNDNSKLKAPMGNYGHIRNTGFEITLNTHPLIGQFQWDSEMQISFNKNKLIALNGTASSAIVGYAQWGQTQVTKTDIGESLYSFYGYVCDGIYQDLQDLETSPKPSAYPTNGVFNGANTTYVGDIKYKDLNGDGVIDENDRTNIGSPLPKFTFGWTNTFRYKNFDLNIFINGSYGNKVMNLTKRNLTTMSSAWSNQHTDVIDRARLEPIDASIVYADGSKWYNHVENVRVANPDASLPRAIIGDPNDNDRISDRYIEDGSYLRLKNLALGYTFPKKVIKSLGVENLRLYCNIQNLFTITGYDGYDPEIGVSTMSINVMGVDYGRYPSPTTYSFGLNMSF
ncbi:MAG: SusC/RagA family TonB-linked outer membrane protein [Prevotella sp.]